ncbi:tyrosine-type recombinase/integrase [Candidatus Tisiphia endosymbiont of Oplodontha viridula]|uniref:tyrosine-type recombinase/integrase n=1 Tax=Candidatus Tisiphia endosymbiont of Oplodontha viridula TaxID=3077925 RepID=UPI0035C8C30E
MLVKSLLFTRELLHEIGAPKVKRDVYKDTKEAGLILIVSYGGSKVFYLGTVINKKYHRIKIGSFPNLSITEARTKAIELENKIAKGYNPLEAKSKLSNELTFAEFYDKYLNEYSKINNKRWQDYAASMNRYAKHLYPMKISTIQKADIQGLFNNLTKSGKYCANRFLDILSPVFNKAIEWELLKVNPVVGIKKHKEQSRDRYLTREELPKFFAVLAEEKNQLIKDFILISLYTSARKGNVLTMRWENIKFIDKIWYIPETKNGIPQSLPLLDQAVEILEARKQQSTSERVFPSEISSSGHLQEPKKGWKRICQKAGIQDLRIHDLRRTIPSWMAMTGANQYVIGKVLNHENPRSTAVYARLGLDTVREYMNKAVNSVIAIKT